MCDVRDQLRGRDQLHAEREARVECEAPVEHEASVDQSRGGKRPSKVGRVLHRFIYFLCACECHPI